VGTSVSISVSSVAVGSERSDPARKPEVDDIKDLLVCTSFLIALSYALLFFSFSLCSNLVLF